MTPPRRSLGGIVQRAASAPLLGSRRICRDVHAIAQARQTAVGRQPEPHCSTRVGSRGRVTVVRNGIARRQAQTAHDTLPASLRFEPIAFHR